MAGVLRVLVCGAVACVLLVLCGSALAAVPLPDGRAWEKVSPLGKNGGDVYGIEGYSGGGIVQAEAEGGAVTYLSQGSFAAPGSTGSELEGAVANQYIARRGPEGWSAQSITTPANAGTYGSAGVGAPYKAFSSGLSAGLLLNGGESEEVGIENPPLPSELEAPPGYQNFYLRTGFGGSLTNTPLLTTAPATPAKEFHLYFQGASPDLKHVVVSSASALTPGAVATTSEPNLYEWAEDAWRPVNVLPGVIGGKTTPGAHLGSGLGESNMVSDDGSRVFWSNGANETEKLYVRKDGAETIWIDAPEQGFGVGPSENPFPRFQAASGDGQKAFFTSHAPLTRDANTGPPCGSACKRAGNDLYEFEVQTGRLKDLSPDSRPQDEAGADVQGVVGASEDGSHVYFVATGVLAGANTEGHAPVDGADNMYVWYEDPLTHVEATKFIATLAPSDEASELERGLPHDWSPEVSLRTSRVTPSGNAVVFMSSARLTGYDNTDALSEAADEEVYLYDSKASRLSCVSCNPLGLRPIGSSSIPGGTPFEFSPNSGGAIYQSRVLSRDGSRVFFDSKDALVPSDSNGQQDVYEYEGGRAYLLSGGTSSDPSEFADASSGGDDVFFLTRQQLVRGDTDQLVDLYDARVGGGLAEPVPPSPCVGESCKPPSSSSPVLGASSSESFVGAGNLAPVAPKPVVKPKPKPRRKHGSKAGKKRVKSRKAGHPRRAARTRTARATAARGWGR